MVKLRLARGGRKKRPFYRIVAAHSPFKRDGRFIEKIGTYNPLAPIGQEIELKEERVIYWLVNGARPTDTARNIFSRKGLMLRYDMLKRGVDEKEIDAAVAEFLKNKEAAVLKKEEAKEQKRQAKPKAVKAETDEKAEVAAEVAETEETASDAAEAPVEEKTEAVAEEVAAEKAEAEPAKEEKTEEAAKSEASEEKAEAEEEAKSE